MFRNILGEVRAIAALCLGEPRNSLRIKEVIDANNKEKKVKEWKIKAYREWKNKKGVSETAKTR